MNLCLFDSRGCGDSSTGCVNFGFKEKIDIMFLMFKIIFEFDLVDFILWGRSIGCNAIL